MKSNSEQKIDQKIDLHQDISFLFWKITMNWHRVLKKILEPHALSHADFIILTILNTKDYAKGVMQNDIVNFSSMDKMTVSKALKRLVRLGFVSRHENPVDTRAKTVNITNIGKDVLKTLSPIIDRKKKEVFSNISDEERIHLINIINNISQDNKSIPKSMKDNDDTQIIYFLNDLLENSISILQDSDYQRRVWFTNKGEEYSCFIDTVSYFIDRSKMIFSIPNHCDIIGRKEAKLLKLLYDLVREFTSETEKKIDFSENDFKEEELMFDPRWQKIIQISGDLYDQLKSKL